MVNESKQGESEFSQRMNEPRYLKPLAKPLDIWHTKVKPIKANTEQARIPIKNAENKKQEKT